MFALEKTKYLEKGKKHFASFSSKENFKKHSLLNTPSYIRRRWNLRRTGVISGTSKGIIDTINITPESIQSILNTLEGIPEDTESNPGSFEDVHDDVEGNSDDVESVRDDVGINLDDRGNVRDDCESVPGVSGCNNGMFTCNHGIAGIGS